MCWCKTCRQGTLDEVSHSISVFYSISLYPAHPRPLSSLGPEEHWFLVLFFNCLLLQSLAQILLQAFDSVIFVVFLRNCYTIASFSAVTAGLARETCTCPLIPFSTHWIQFSSCIHLRTLMNPSATVSPQGQLSKVTLLHHNIFNHI